MAQRYTIRTYEDANGRNSTSSGTIVALVLREMSIYAESANEAEMQLRDDVASGGLPAGRIYQICPWLSNPELVRSVAASLDGSFQRVFLDPAAGLYSDLRRVRVSNPLASKENGSPSEYALI